MADLVVPISESDDAREVAKRALDAAGVGHQEHMLTGPKAETIVRFAAPGRAVVGGRLRVGKALLLLQAHNKVRRTERDNVTSPTTPDSLRTILKSP